MSSDVAPLAAQAFLDAATVVSLAATAGTRCVKESCGAACPTREKPLLERLAEARRRRDADGSNYRLRLATDRLYGTCERSVGSLRLLGRGDSESVDAPFGT